MQECDNFQIMCMSYQEREECPSGGTPPESGGMECLHVKERELYSHTRRGRCVPRLSHNLSKLQLVVGKSENVG